MVFDASMVLCWPLSRTLGDSSTAGEIRKSRLEMCTTAMEISREWGQMHSPFEIRKPFEISSEPGRTGLRYAAFEYGDWTECRTES